MGETVEIKIDSETKEGQLIIEKAKGLMLSEIAYKLAGKNAAQDGKDFWGLVAKIYPEVSGGYFDHEKKAIIFYKE